jgi:PhnB protein
MAVKAIPDGYHSITPGCAVEGAAKAIDFYKKVFDANEHVRINGPNGSVAHAELKIGDSLFMLGDAGAQTPKYSMHVMLYTQDADSVFKRAVEAGCTVNQPMQDMFWGDRAGRVSDPFGNDWFIATHKEDVSPEEMEKRMKAMK